MASEKKPKEPDPTPSPVQTVSISARRHLECTAGPEKGQRLRAAPNVTLIGRDAACDVVLSETTVSRQHARIERRPDRWLFRNLSANGTLLNKKPVDEAVLADGDEIRIGAKTRLRFVVEEVALSASGRPQFRRRVAPKKDEVSEPEKPAAEAEEPAKPSLFKRRKRLFIGLAIYLAGFLVLLVVGLIYFSGGGATGGSSEISVLHEDDTVIKMPDGQTLRVPGIRTALDVKFKLRGQSCPGRTGQK